MLRDLYSGYPNTGPFVQYSNGIFKNRCVRYSNSSECWTIFVRYSDGDNVQRFFCLKFEWYNTEQTFSSLLFKWYLNGGLFHFIFFVLQKIVVCGIISIYDSRNIPLSKLNRQMSPVGCGTTTKRP